MTAYYNEHDPFAAAWLRELIKAGLITDGDVDERDIQEVKAHDVRGYTQAHFFAGIGGWSYALRLAGWPDDRAVWTGSCPCQPFSAAGSQTGGNDPRDLWPAWHQLIAECRPAIVFGEQVESAIAHGWLDRICDDLEGEDYAVGAVGLPAAGVGAFHIRQRLWFVAESEGEQHNGRGNQRRRGTRSPNGSQSPRDVGDADVARSQGRPLYAERAGERAPRAPSVASELADAVGERRTRERLLLRPEASGRDAGEVSQTAGRGAVDWAAGDWLPCADGKARPVEPGIEPLVARLPGELVPSGDPSESYANASTEGRVGRLRGYGNAIVPPLAAVFIEAYLDVRHTP